ncbi:HAMP domain-containing sensor histidine kinase [Marinomonas algicola]|uniref:HAMP domain-containing sensor histidine kinase n=1 Tax=Marinomonas algicola TaxID=2773454 RepID=UPI00174885FD|nr:HAMP domain-containing sensor histidine kinase [Marinomonas algicola]
MKNTFFRVFLVILLSNIVVVSIGFGVVKLIQRPLQVSADVLGDVGVQLVTAYEKLGEVPIKELAKKYEQQLSGKLFLYQENGVSLLKPLPRNFPGKNEGRLGRPLADFLDSQFIQVIGTSNVQYLLIYRPSPHLKSSNSELILPFSFLGLLVSSAVVAYWLLGPLLKLQKATRSFGRGDMEARVDVKLAQRSDAIGKLAQEFNEMAERIEVLLSSKERLMRDVSHELRTPLSRIEVALTIAEDKQGLPIQQSYLDRIRNELHELDELIGQVLTLSRLEAASLKKEKIDLQRWVNDIVDDVNFESQLKSVHVVKIGAFPKVLLGDPLQLRHAVENVLRNACFYASEGGRVEIETKEVSGYAQIIIRDEGPGVDEDKLEKIFHAFYRSSSARESNSGGFGVGLTIAQRIIRAHNGAIEASNRPQGGLEVRFSLPVG